VDAFPTPSKSPYPQQPSPALIFAWQSDDPQQVEAALSALEAERPGPGDEPGLRAMMPRWRDEPGVLLRLLEVYGFVASLEAAPELFALLRHPHPEVVVTAAGVLDDIGDARLSERALEEFLRLIDHPDPEVGPSVVHLISAIDDWEGHNPVSPARLTETLCRLAEHPALRVRAVTADVLWRWSYEPERVNALMARLMYAPEPEVCSPALARVGATGDSAALDRLLTLLAEPDPHPDLVLAAGRMGSGSGSRQMKRTLRKALKRLRSAGWTEREPERRVNRMKNMLSLLSSNPLSGWL
jgi:hypothetical protein